MISGIRSAPLDSAYVNSYGEPRTRDVSESDMEWNLDMDRLATLEQIYLNHQILDKIMLQKQSSDSVIFRDNVL
jgi:hypothetical protein